MSTVSPSDSAFQFLCVIARPQPDLNVAGEALRKGLDFAKVQHLAQEHAVRPQLVAAYGQLGWEGVPSEVRTECAVFQRLHVARMLSLSDELRRIDALFAANAVPLVAFKGAALAAFLYGDLSQREYGDLDILVPGEKVATAERLLGSLGYSGPHDDSEFRHAFLAFQQQYSFVRESKEIAVDLHWHFNGVHSPFPLQPQDVWGALAHVRIGGQQVATLAGANLALLLAGHGMKESWKRLSWVRDFATLIVRNPDLDWIEIFHGARGRGCGNAVLVGCTLAEKLLGVDVPAALAESVRDSRTVQRMSAALEASLRRGDSLPPVRPYLEDLDLCDHWYDKLQSIAQQAVTRTAGDYAAWPLPPPLWRVYYLTRPFRLLVKAARRLLKLGHVS